MNRFKLLPTILAKLLINIVFRTSCLLFKVDKEKITFASYRSEKLSGNLYYVWKELQEEYPNYHCHYAFKRYHGTLLGKVDYLFHMLKASYYMATSRYFVIDDYFFPVYVIKPREGTEIIQLWHASGALKKFGMSTVGKSFGPSEEYLKHVKIHSNYSKVFVSSTEVIPYYAEAFDLPENKIYPLGIPRTDYFFEREEIDRLRIRFFQSYPKLKSKKLILYAPTFRGSSHYQDVYRCPLDFDLMRKDLEKDYVLLIHLHPYMRAGIDLKEKDKDFVYHIHGDYNIQELLALADILVTDYSTVFFDYSMLNRPIAFFATDLEEYTCERDFYYPYQSIIPGPLFTDTEPLIKWIKEGQFDMEKLEEFRNRFFNYIDGNASKRIVHHLIDEKKAN